MYLLGWLFVYQRVWCPTVGSNLRRVTWRVTWFLRYKRANLSQDTGWANLLAGHELWAQRVQAGEDLGEEYRCAEQAVRVATGIMGACMHARAGIASRPFVAALNVPSLNNDGVSDTSHPNGSDVPRPTAAFPGQSTPPRGPRSPTELSCAAGSGTAQ